MPSTWNPVSWLHWGSSLTSLTHHQTFPPLCLFQRQKTLGWPSPLHLSASKTCFAFISEMPLLTVGKGCRGEYEIQFPFFGWSNRDVSPHSDNKFPSTPRQGSVPSYVGLEAMNGKFPDFPSRPFASPRQIVQKMDWQLHHIFVSQLKLISMFPTVKHFFPFPESLSSFSWPSRILEDPFIIMFSM